MSNQKSARPLWPAIGMPVFTALLIVLAGCERGHISSPPTSPNADPNAVSVSHSASAAAVTPLAAAESRAYSGDATCSGCHSDIYRQFVGTAHANTLRRVDAQSFGKLFRSPQVLRDPAIGYKYRTDVRNRRCVLVCDGAAGRIEASADLAVGRGHSGITFIGKISDSDWATLRLSYYTTRRAWMFSPGQSPGNMWQPPVGQRLTPTEVVACLSCHVTYLRATDGRLDIDASHIGIGCERCHGPARQHVEAARRMGTDRAFPLAPAGNDLVNNPAQVEALCAPCHSATEQPARNGDVSSIREIERFEATALEASRCYRESQGLTCVSCHNPHGDVTHDVTHQEADTDKVCVRCHARPALAPTDRHVAYGAGNVCPVNARSGCVRCHMPAARFADVPSLPFRNHWIKVYKSKKLEEGKAEMKP